MNYSKIIPCDTANGKGCRVSLFVSGCTHGCEGCFNPESHDFNYGQEFTEKTVDKILGMVKQPQIAGLSILGGDPMCQNGTDLITLFTLCMMVRRLGKDVWLWTGDTYEEIIGNTSQEFAAVCKKILLKQVDVLIDGRFELDKRDITLPWKGSSNQRVIDMNKTREEGEMVIYDC